MKTIDNNTLDFFKNLKYLFSKYNQKKDFVGQSPLKDFNTNQSHAIKYELIVENRQD